MWISRAANKQPSDWSRHHLEDVVDLVVQSSQRTQPLALKEGDTILELVLSQRPPVSVRYITEDHTPEVPVSGKVPQAIVLRAKPMSQTPVPINPLWIFHTVNDPGFVSSWIANHDGLVQSSFSLSKILAKMQVAIPDSSVQNELVEMLNLSDMCLKQQAAQRRRQAELLLEMNTSINHELLLGKLSREQAISWLKKSLNPMDEESPEPSPSSPKKPLAP